MMFEYIKPLDPPPVTLDLRPLRPTAQPGDAPTLAELVARVRLEPGMTSLACPLPPLRRLELPRFSGASLADVVLQARLPEPEREPLPVVAPLPPEPRTLLGPGAMTMTLAIAATLAFGVFVATH